MAEFVISVLPTGNLKLELQLLVNTFPGGLPGELLSLRVSIDLA